MFVAVIEILPEPECLAYIPSPLVPSIAPLADIVKSPVPAFSALIPLAEPVTWFAVIVIAVPLAVVFLAKIPWLPAPEPVTTPVALISTEPVPVFVA